MKKAFSKLSAAVITVGDGRGFIVNGPDDNRLIITAAHCLPSFPPCHGASYTEERTYAKLLVRLNSPPYVWAECLFVDPIADLTVLGSPDGQVLFEEAIDYERFTQSVSPLPIAEAPKEAFWQLVQEPHPHWDKSQANAWLLSLKGQWFDCKIHVVADGPIEIKNASQPIEGGMSGSPIVSVSGEAVGVLCPSSAQFSKGHLVSGRQGRGA